MTSCTSLSALSNINCMLRCVFACNAELNLKSVFLFFFSSLNSWSFCGQVYSIPPVLFCFYWMIMAAILTRNSDRTTTLMLDEDDKKGAAFVFHHHITVILMRWSWVLCPKNWVFHYSFPLISQNLSLLQRCQIIKYMMQYSFQVGLHA